MAHRFSFLCCIFGGVCVAHRFSFLCCVFGGVCVAHRFSFLYCVAFVFLVGSVWLIVLVFCSFL